MVRKIIIDQSLMQFFCCPTESIVYLTFELLFIVKKKKNKTLLASRWRHYSAVNCEKHLHI